MSFLSVDTVSLFISQNDYMLLLEPGAIRLCAVCHNILRPTIFRELYNMQKDLFLVQKPTLWYTHVLCISSKYLFMARAEADIFAPFPCIHRKGHVLPFRTTLHWLQLYVL